MEKEADFKVLICKEVLGSSLDFSPDLFSSLKPPTKAVHYQAREHQMIVVDPDKVLK